MIDRSCFDCRFFCEMEHQIAAEALEEKDRDCCMQGHCRRETPVVGHYRGEDEALPYDYGQWPLVLAGDWCGRFEPCQRIGHDAPQTAPVGPRCQNGRESAPGPNQAQNRPVGRATPAAGRVNGSFLT